MAISKGPQAFPRSEYLRRTAAVKAQMAHLDVDALFVTHPANVAWLTGCIVRHSSPQGVVVSMHKDEPTFLVRRADSAAAIHQGFLERENLVVYPENRSGNPNADGWNAVIAHLKESGLATRGLALEMHHLNAETAETLRQSLPEARIVDSEKAVVWARLIKSDLEVATMRESAAIADAAMKRATEVIRPDVHEADVVAEILAAQARGANGKSGTGIPPVGPIFMCSSPRTGVAHIQWSDDTIRKGSQINLEVTGVRHGYVTVVMRTFSLGAPSDRLRRVHEGEVAGLEAALATIRPGATCSDVAGAFYRAAEKHGVKKDTRCGYAIGLDWMEPSANFNESDKIVLKPNMTFHLMLGNWIDDDFGYVNGQTIRVSETGVEVLTKTPPHLFVI